MYIYTYTFILHIYYRIRFELFLTTNINPSPSQHYFLECVHCSYAKNSAQREYYKINPLAAKGTIRQRKIVK